jgi:hypothetical protein
MDRVESNRVDQDVEDRSQDGGDPCYGQAARPQVEGPEFAGVGYEEGGSVYMLLARHDYVMIQDVRLVVDTYRAMAYPMEKVKMNGITAIPVAAY